MLNQYTVLDDTEPRFLLAFKGEKKTVMPVCTRRPAAGDSPLDRDMESLGSSQNQFNRTRTRKSRQSWKETA